MGFPGFYGREGISEVACFFLLAEFSVLEHSYEVFRIILTLQNYISRRSRENA